MHGMWLILCQIGRGGGSTPLIGPPLPLIHTPLIYTTDYVNYIWNQYIPKIGEVFQLLYYIYNVTDCSNDSAGCLRTLPYLYGYNFTGIDHWPLWSDWCIYFKLLQGQLCLGIPMTLCVTFRHSYYVSCTMTVLYQFINPNIEMAFSVNCLLKVNCSWACSCLTPPPPHPKSINW